MKGFYVPCQKTFTEKVFAIKNSGLSKLYFVSDFDRTLTGKNTEGKTPTTSWTIFLSELGELYAKERNDLFNTYYPIEKDTALDIPYKSEQMSIWFTKHLELLIRNKVSLSIIKKVIQDEQLKLRNGVNELLCFAKNNSIPFLIFSAGIGDAITIQLETDNLKTENVHVLSNFFEFDQNGNAIGFQRQIVHTFNKNETLIRTKECLEQTRLRSNCILLGDSIHDTTMADGMGHNIILKIGFLNGNKEHRTEFGKVYDAIIEEDTDISPILELVKML